MIGLNWKKKILKQRKIKMKFLITILLLLTSLASPIPAAADLIYLDDGNSHTISDDTTQNAYLYLDYNTINDPGTHANIVNGAVIGFDLAVFNNATASITGGSIMRNLYAPDNAHVSISGGSIDGWLEAADNATVTISGGSIGGRVRMHDDTTLTFSGGLIDSLTLDYDATAAVTGGSITTYLTAFDSTSITMSGGSVGTYFSALDDGNIYLNGDNFQVTAGGITTSLSNGDKLSNYGTVGTDTWGNNYFTGVVTGTLADGSVVDNTFQIFNTGNYAGTADIIIIPEPATVILLGLGGLVLRKRKTTA